MRSFIFTILIFLTTTLGVTAEPKKLNLETYDTFIGYGKPLEEVYKTEDVLLLFKSCYETIHFLATTKYKRTRTRLTEEDVAKQCFCICDKVRRNYKPSEFLDQSPLEIHNIITPLAKACLRESDTPWYNDELEKGKNNDNGFKRVPNE